MQPVAVLAAFVAVASLASAGRIPEPEVQRTWESFKIANAKTYPTALDETFRRKIFKENIISIAKHNALFDEGDVSFNSFKLRINQYSDLLPYEVHEKLNGLRPGHKREQVLPDIGSHPTDLEVQQHWTSFKTVHGKTYPTALDETFRRKIFKENLISIAKHNALFDEGLVSFKLQVNQNSDLLPSEVAEKYNGFRAGLKRDQDDVTAIPSHPTELQVEHSWNNFKVVHGKAYPTALDETFRRKIFKENLITIAKHNALFDEGLVSFKLGVNQYSDLLSHEVAEKLNGLRPGLKPSKIAAGHGLPDLTGRPSELDLQQHWTSFKVTNGKTYPSKLDETFRRKIFKENLISIAKHNALFNKGVYTYKLRVNKFSDLLSHEVAEKMNSVKRG